MKKLILAFLAAILVLSLSACRRNSIALPAITPPVGGTTPPTTQETEPIVTPPNLHIYGMDAPDLLS